MAAKNVNSKNKAPEKIITEPSVHMFAGEIVIARANVMRYNNMSNRSCGAVGMLFFTNFKVVFSCSGNSETQELKVSCGLENLLSEERNNNIDDFIPLTAIHQVYAVSTLKQKRKKIKHSRKKEVSSHYDIVEIQTKDFRIIQYDFKFAPQQQRSWFQAISHHMCPTSITNLFAFDYGRHISSSNLDIGRAFSSFRNQKDYEMNLSRLKSSEHWRVSSINSSFSLCKSLPELLVSPAELEDKTLENIASKYVDNRLPIYLWSDPSTGVALLLSSDLRDKNASFTHPIKLLESISACQFKGSGFTTSVDVTETCPTLRELKQQFNKLRKVCVSHSVKEYWNSDSDWLGNVEDSGWMQVVSDCLDLSIKVTKIIKERATSVIVQDGDGRNFSILITSLVQILLDPYYRTHLGLEALIQKDWVMKGFPFSKRLGSLQHHLKQKDKEEPYKSESPLFLLFLDCVHQLLRQFPLKFEYTEQFLVLLVDCSYSSLFSTFLFDSDFELQQASDDNTKFVTAWDFIEENIPRIKFSSVLSNPAFKCEEIDVQGIDDQLDKHSLSSVSSSCDDQAGVDVLYPSVKQIDLHLWYSFYYRWYPCTDLRKGCSTEVMLQLQQKQFVEEVRYLQDRYLQLQHMSSITHKHARSVSNLSSSSNCSSGARKKTKHKRNPSKFSYNEEEKDGFLYLMSGFYFLNML